MKSLSTHITESFTVTESLSSKEIKDLAKDYMDNHYYGGHSSGKAWASDIGKFLDDKLYGKGPSTFSSADAKTFYKELIKLGHSKDMNMQDLKIHGDGYFS